MNKTMKTSLVALGLLAFGFAITSKVNAQTSTGTVGAPVDGDVYLTVNAGELTIGTSGASLNLGTGNAEDVKEGKFSDNSFYVSDLKGAESGYYTTISVSDLTGSFNGATKTISADNVLFRAGGAKPVTITGDDNNAVVFNSELSTGQTILSSDQRQYMKRDNNGGILGVYGDAPYIQVKIPKYASPTTYHGVITYTLIEND